MEPIITPDELDAFGFGDAELTPVEMVTLPERDATEARGGREVAAITLPMVVLALSSEQFRFRRASSARLESRGLSLAVLPQHPRIASLRSRPDSPLLVLEGGERDKDYVQTAEDPAAVYFSSSELRRVIVSDGQTLAVLWWDDSLGTYAARITDRSIDKWAEACDDAWLADQIRRQAAVGGSWRQAIAAGLYARLYQPADSAAGAARVRDFRNGRIETRFTEPREWAKTLHETQAIRFESLALAEIDGLHAAMDDLEVALDEGSEEWVDAWRDICHRRDELEGVKLVLQERGKGAALQSTLEQLDRRGRQFLINIPEGVLQPDIQLERANLLDPTAWWTDPDLLDAL